MQETQSDCNNLLREHGKYSTVWILEMENEEGILTSTQSNSAKALNI